MLLRYLLPTLLVLHAAETPPPLEEPISVDSVTTYFNVNPETDKVALFRALPESYRGGWMWMIDSSSEQTSACDEPRVILPGPKGSPVFAFSTVRDEKGKYTDPGTLKKLIECNLQKEGKPVPKGIEMEELVTREFLRRNGSLSTGTTGIYPDHEKYDTTPQLAQMIYLLKPEGVDTDRWSLAPPGSNTSTFGDLFAAYINRFQKVIEKPVRCDDLETASMKAMAVHIAPPPSDVSGGTHKEGMK